jgi:hypothetical protein
MGRDLRKVAAQYFDRRLDVGYAEKHQTQSADAPI